jgi:acyl-CoA thioesterase-1
MKMNLLLAVMTAIVSTAAVMAGKPTGLDGASGNIFKFDLKTRSFELLKETEYDPKTDLGKSRFTVHWDEKTRMTRVTRDTKAKIISEEPAQAEQLATGFWQATLQGRQDGERFVVESMQVSPLEDPRATDDPNLPRVLVIGDSISMNYHEAAKAALKGIANYHRNEGNSFSSVHGVNNAELWLGDYRQKGLHWDVIQFNHGLHDLKQTYDPKTDTFGDYAVSLEVYKQSLEKEIAILKKTGATLIWCSTTPVPRDNKSRYARRKGAEEPFNQAAAEVMRRHPEILCNDLHTVVRNSPVYINWRNGTDVHFYQKPEQELLGSAVAEAVKTALKQRK